MITLAEALASNKLEAFIEQEEARGVGPIDRTEFDRATAKIVRVPQSEDRTSRSSSGDGSNETKTRRGSGQGA